ncbi:uncharacterized protein J4E87_008755 [Alternaria ethzedia]|uniref:uncharacterized protein n=1 Tax=Alternaria ethzedia TaxID=181014 RepID=UPI0020C2D579|nr:uncharacterized protein J4E87_008755 [Alternaria ethzedia]KAI4616243.1 hypothetical protein J4E87_008755 [Alternaria ethzedia]
MTEEERPNKFSISAQDEKHQSTIKIIQLVTPLHNMASENLSYPSEKAAVINKLSQAIKALDTSVPASFQQHRRYLYLLERLRNEITDQVNEWKGQNPDSPPYKTFRLGVDAELEIPVDPYQETPPPKAELWTPNQSCPECGKPR